MKIQSKALDHTLEEYDFDNISPKSFFNERSQESICADDNRVKVTDTSFLPFKAICKLYMKAANGRNLVGTGWLSHKNKLFTAGHNLFDPEVGGWMTSIIVVPGLNGRKEPFGRYNAIDICTTDEWLQSQSKDYDLGAIKLSDDVSHDDFLEPTLSDANFGMVSGYPLDRDQALFQYQMTNPLRKVGRRFFYYIDTFGGMSGSPVLSNGSNAIAVHNFGGCENSASDLTRDFVEHVNNW